MTNDVKNSGVTSEQLIPIMEGINRIDQSTVECPSSPHSEESEAKPLEKGEGELGKEEGASTLGQEKSEAEEKPSVHRALEEVQE